MIFREVFGWLHYGLAQDPICLRNGVVAEELVSPAVSLNDKTDGARTLALYKKDQGYTPRVEVRFTILNPQVWYITKDGEEFISSPSSVHYPWDPTDTRPWNTTDFVNYLISLAKARLCHDTEVLVTLIKAKLAWEDYQEPKKLDKHVVRDIIGKIKDAPSEVKQEELQEWLLKNVQSPTKTGKAANMDDFAAAVVEHFLAGRLKWVDIQPLQNKYGKGNPIIPWGYFANKFGQAPAAMKQLPLTIQEDIVTPKSKQVRSMFDAVVKAANEGKKLSVQGSAAERCADIVSVLASGALPLPYLDVMEQTDKSETIAPWSFIRRSIIAYKAPKTSKENVCESILAWLDKARITKALYDLDDSPELRDVVSSRIETFAAHTVDNHSWVVAVLDPISCKEDPSEAKRGLQTEFDMWLLQALHPTTSSSKLPLSPYAYRAGRQEEELYNTVFATWLNRLKKTADDRRQHSVKSLSTALSHFYQAVTSGWEPDLLEDYSPKIPSVSQISLAVKSSNKSELLNLLLADVEDEVGSKVPETMKAELLDSPYFNNIYKEVRFQNVKL